MPLKRSGGHITNDRRHNWRDFCCWRYNKNKLEHKLTIPLQYQQLLPPGNEVCEGYVFTGVCLSTGCVCGRGACMVGGMHGRGACVAGWHAWWGSWMVEGGCMWQVGACKAGGMHATHAPPLAATMRYGQ